MVPPILAQRQASHNQFSRILATGSLTSWKRLGRCGNSVEGLSTSAETHLTLFLRQEHFLQLESVTRTQPPKRWVAGSLGLPSALRTAADEWALSLSRPKPGLCTRLILTFTSVCSTLIQRETDHFWFVCSPPVSSSADEILGQQLAAGQGTALGPLLVEVSLGTSPRLNAAVSSTMGPL